MKKYLILLFFIFILATACNKSQTKNKQNSENIHMVRYATIETDKGAVKAELYVKQAPITAKNFIDLANSGFYNGLTFHRVDLEKQSLSRLTRN